MTPKSAVFLLALSLLGVSLSGCGDSKSGDTQPAGPTADSSRDELLALLVTKADEFAAADQKAKAQDAYTLALVYGAEGVAEKLRDLGDVPLRGMTEEQAQRLLKVIQEAPLDFENWPASSEATERVELRLLLDPQLVGDLERGNLSVEEQDAGVSCFLAAPGKSLDQVLAAYGEPMKKDEKEGYRTLTYGRVRVIGDKTGDVMAVLFRS
jgi:hypothetical protein